MPDIFKEMLFTDGEGVEPEDFNVLQRFAGALLLDGIIGRMMRTNDIAFDTNIDYAWCFGNDAAPYESVTTRLSSNIQGTIFQRVSSSNPDGDDYNVLPYYVAADEYAVTHDAAAVNPRWDLISVKLEQIDNDVADEEERDFEDAATREKTTDLTVKRRKVKATFTVTKGTEAGSPVVPATPAGNVRLAAYRVYPGMTTFVPSTDIRDFRMPFGQGFEEVHNGMGLYGASVFDGNGNTDNVNGAKDANSGSHAEFILPVTGGSRRITRVQAVTRYSGGAAPTAEIIRKHVAGDDSYTRVSLYDVSGTFHTGTDAASPEFQSYNLLSSKPDEPLWANGWAAGFAVQRHTAGGRGDDAFDPLRPTALGVLFTTPGTTTVVIRSVRFQYVGGL